MDLNALNNKQHDASSIDEFKMLILKQRQSIYYKDSFLFNTVFESILLIVYVFTFLVKW